MMGSEVEQAASHVQTTLTTPSAASTSGPKLSMFSRKSGFVIPKNKLSGSLVPVFRGGKKGDSYTVNVEGTKPVQRKTKWGPDLSMDTIVRKGRALAYQTRVVQITQQLSLETEDSLLASRFQDKKSSTCQLNNEKSELLELERREAIGEILKLNPSFKAPSDYKPLPKEANVPIPIKEYPDYNFISLVFGPASDTLKQLEKETGAKIRVYGTRTDTGGKVEVTPSDGKETHGAYEELYIHVSADTYEKVDAAVALIELLVNPISMNLAPVSETLTTASSDNKSDPSTEGTPGSYMPPAIMNQGVIGSVPAPMQGHFPQYSQPWFPAGPTQIPIHPRSALVSSAPLQNNIAQISSPFNPSSMPSLFGPQPVLASSFGQVPQNLSVIPSRPQLTHVLQQPYTHQAHPFGQFGIPRDLPRSSLQFTTALPTPTGAHQIVRPVMSSSAPQGEHMLSMAPSTVPFQRQPVASHPMVVSGAPPVNISAIPFAVTSSTPPLLQHGNANSVSGTVPNFETMKPLSLAVPRPQQPNSSDFTFQPRGPQKLASQPGIQPTLQIMTPPNETMQAPLTPQSPLIRPLVHNLNHPVQGFPRPLVNHPISQPRPKMPMNFAGSPTAPPVPLRHPTFSAPSVISHSTMPRTPRNFNPAYPIVHSVRPFPPRAGNPMHHQQNYPSGATRPQRFMAPHQHFGNNPGRPHSGAQQTYDPFSPTSVSFNPHMGGGTAKMQKESDPEYEDLMSSVGVK
ncbi:splicing factor 1-like isoform X2 [Olea europaea var. sylvestris]|uniref:splicing factor 1-like isoform X2 n=1 Tax=Olea europaea var. sylvestris TaxID=158386 RepID=UPI000C1CD292|nr:splicing factor 1-like isoform X2 [Olea europaea var. sylvestris]